MKKIYVGIDIDISKEKSNLCFRSGLEIVREEKCPNDVKGLKKAFKTALKTLGASLEEVLVCAEYTGRYIYPLTVAAEPACCEAAPLGQLRIKKPPQAGMLFGARG